jgi:hypothetical protein
MTPVFEEFDFAVIADNYSPIAPAGNAESELPEVLSLPVFFDHSPPHPTTPVEEFVFSEQEFYDTAAELTLTANDHLAWTGQLLEDYCSESFLSSSTGLSGTEPSSSSGFSVEENLGSDPAEWPLNPNDLVLSPGCLPLTA